MSRPVEILVAVALLAMVGAVAWLHWAPRAPVALPADARPAAPTPLPSWTAADDDVSDAEWDRRLGIGRPPPPDARRAVVDTAAP